MKNDPQTATFEYPAVVDFVLDGIHWYDSDGTKLDGFGNPCIGGCGLCLPAV